MNTPSQPRTSHQFALLVTLIGILVVVLTIALAEMTVTAHQNGGGSDCIMGCGNPHDASMDSLSCTKCHQFQNNGLVQIGQTMHSGKWDTWYAQIFAGAGFLLGKLPDQLTSQATGHSESGIDAGPDQTYQPAASEDMSISNPLSHLHADDRSSKVLH